MKPRTKAWSRIWAAVRALAGDDAYERYLAHCRNRHPGVTPLGREAFCRQEQERRWQGINRCC